MYLGKIMEKSGVEDLFVNTLHPYTKALLASIPEPAVHKTKERTIIKGEITSPVNPKPGCRFAARCAYAQSICFSKNVILEELLPNHFVACHFVRDINNLNHK